MSRSRSKTGVYQIRNCINDKCYIGSAAGVKGFRERWNQHIVQLNRGNHHSIYLQRAWNKYGVDSFIFEVLEECDSQFCIEREQHYLDTVLFANDNDKRFYQLGYNICRVAGSTLGLKLHLSENSIAIRRAQGKILGKINRKLTDFIVLSILDDISIHHMPIRDIAQKYQVSNSTITDIRSNRTWKDIDRSKYGNLKACRAKHPGLTEKTKARMSLAKRGEGTHLSKLTEIEVIQIKEMIHNGYNNHEIAKLFHVDHSNISKIRRGKTWRYIDDKGKVAISCQANDSYRHKGKTP